MPTKKKAKGNTVKKVSKKTVKKAVKKAVKKSRNIKTIKKEKILSMRDILKAEFSDEAITVNENVKPIQIGIKPQYIIERLTDVFGIDGWEHNIDKDINGKACVEHFTSHWEYNGQQKENKSVVCYGTLIIKNKDGKIIRTISSPGGANVISGRMSDAIKSARTDSLGKCASYIEIAHQAYKGQLENPNKKKETPKKLSPIKEIQMAVKDFMKQYQISKDQMIEDANEFVDGEAVIKDWDVDQWGGFYDFLNNEYND